jgi:hypothetical protein
VEWAINKYKDAARIPTRSEIAEVMDNWGNTNMNRVQSIIYHVNEHGEGETLKTLTESGKNVWSTYMNNPSLVRSISNPLLKSGELGVKIQLNSGAGGIFTNSGKIITNWTN